MRAPLPARYRWGTGLKTGIQPVPYSCGFCGHATADDKAYYPLTTGSDDAAAVGVYSIRICGFCQRPTFLEQGEPNTPAERMGESVEHLPQDIESLYDEMRSTTGVGAYTAAVLAARKILMHVAVDKGAGEGEPFATYVEFLTEKHFIPTGAEVWVDYIRNRANEANHEINLMTQADADALVRLTTQLLRNVYELPGAVPAIESTGDGEDD